MLTLMNKQKNIPIVFIPEHLLIEECPIGYSVFAIESKKVSLLDIQYIMHSLDCISAASKNVFILARCTKSGADFSVILEIRKRSRQTPEENLVCREIVNTLKAEMTHQFGVVEAEWSAPVDSRIYVSKF